MNHRYKIDCSAPLTEEGQKILEELRGAPDTILEIVYHKGTFPDPPMETVIVHDMTFKYKCVAIGKDGCFVARYELDQKV